ncbi:MAG: hypothetical protein HY319_29735 [Armatimonadetes bacterium]|nr:hypothetical protein [Armatimonadota bacterium]
MVRPGLCRLAQLLAGPRAEPVRVPLFSPRLGLRRWLSVQVPPGYRPGRAYPIAYLFRGHYTEWLNPAQDASRAEILPARVLRAIETGELPPLVLVFPCLGSDDRRFHTVAADWGAAHQARSASGMGLGRFESHLVHEVLPRVESALQLEEPCRLAIGFSLGGLVALQLALRHPRLFSHVGAYDPSFFRDPPDAEDTILHHTMFDPVFGRPRDSTRVKTHSPIWLCRQLPQEQLQRMKFYLQSGPEAAEPNDSNYERTARFLRELQARGLSNQLPQVVEEGHHDWETADRFVLRVLRAALGRTLDPEGTRDSQQEQEGAKTD